MVAGGDGAADGHDRLAQRDEHEQPVPLGQMVGVEVQARELVPAQGGHGEVQRRRDRPDHQPGSGRKQGTDDQHRPGDERTHRVWHQPDAAAVEQPDDEQDPGDPVGQGEGEPAVRIRRGHRQGHDQPAEGDPEEGEPPPGLVHVELVALGRHAHPDPVDEHEDDQRPD